MKSRLHHAPRADSMKCVQVIGQGIPIRLTNEDADRLVGRGHGLPGDYFCPKSVFKAYRKAHPDHPAHSRIDSQGKIVAR
jgi:hypothetical protein